MIGLLWTLMKSFRGRRSVPGKVVPWSTRKIQFTLPSVLHHDVGEDLVVGGFLIGSVGVDGLMSEIFFGS